MYNTEKEIYYGKTKCARKDACNMRYCGVFRGDTHVYYLYSSICI